MCLVQTEHVMNTTHLVRVKCEVWSQQAACISVVVVVHFIHVVRRVPNFHVYPSIRHGLPLHTLSSEVCGAHHH